MVLDSSTTVLWFVWFKWICNTFKENASKYSIWSLVETHLPPRVHKSHFSDPLAADLLKLSLLPVMVRGIMTINMGKMHKCTEGTEQGK